MRKISTKDMSREEWLAERKKGIGGSDTACILGLNKYKSPFALYNEKKSDVIEETDSEAMRIGRDLEEYVAKRFTEASGIKVRKENAIMINDDFPFIRANIDRLCVGVKAGLECKTASAWNEKSFKNTEFPASYYVQCCTYMAVTGVPVWYLAVLIMGREFKIYKLTTLPTEVRNKPDWCQSVTFVPATDIAALISSCKDFWENNIQKNTPPAIYNAGDDMAITSVCNPAKGNEIDLTAVADKLAEITSLKEQIDALTSQKKQLEQEVKMFMRDNGKGYAEGYNVTFSKFSKTTYDLKAFAKENPKVDLKPYEKVSESTRLMIKKAE